MLATSRLAAFYAQVPTRRLPWLPIQDEFLSDPGKRVLIRTGNQAFGKTSALCDILHTLAEGRHHDANMRGRPLRIIAISLSEPQSVAFQTKIWKSRHPGMIDLRTQFDEVLGFRGRRPACRWNNGTVCIFRTGKAGPGSFAGETADVVIIDEPTTYAMYREADRRVMIRGGYVYMGMTSVNLPGPIDWLRDLVAAGAVSEHHTKLVPEALIPVGHDEPRYTDDGQPMDEKWIEQQRAGMDPHVAAIVLDGDWETPVEGQAFPAFDPRPGYTHVVTEVPADLDLELWVGIDHGERDHKQCALLVGLQQGGAYPAVWVLDEYRGDGLTLPEQDAAGILAMLSRWGWGWSDLKGAYGDKPHDIRRVARSMARKGNADLQVAIARSMGRAPGQIVPIRQAKTGRAGRAGSVERGARWLHACMLRADGFKIHVNATHTIEALSRWAWKDDEHKDLIDALRYATWLAASRTARILGEQPTVRVR